MTHVLFVCVRNGGKSQMAEGLFRRILARHGTTDVTAGSAGTHAGTGLNLASVRALAEVGVDISAARTTQLTAELLQRADWIIVLGTEADVPATAGTNHEIWETDEPSDRGIEGDRRMRLVRDDIDRRVADLYDRLTGGART